MDPAANVCQGVRLLSAYTPSIRLTQQVILNAKYCIEFMIYINPVVFEPELMFGYI